MSCKTIFVVESAGVFHKFLPPLLVEVTHQGKIWQNDFAHLFSLRFSDILLARELRKSLVNENPVCLVAYQRNALHVF